MIRAIHFSSVESFEQHKTPGSIRITPRQAAGLFELAYFCPCGCGTRNSLLIGEGFKPEGTRASWTWNGSRSEAGLEPSVHQVGHWHGHLRNGYWREVGEA
ncbi:DUF6527 family protein [Pseudoroseicyclus sp. H15]